MPLETRCSIIANLQLTHYNTNNQTQTIDIKEVYNLCAVSHPKQNDIDVIPLSKIKGIQTRRGTKSTSFSSQKTGTKSISFLQISTFPSSIYFANQFQDQPEVFQFKERRKLTLLIWSYTLKSQNVSTLSHLVGTKAWQVQVNNIIMQNNKLDVL